MRIKNKEIKQRRHRKEQRIKADERALRAQYADKPKAVAGGATAAPKPKAAPAPKKTAESAAPKAAAPKKPKATEGGAAVAEKPAKAPKAEATEEKPKASKKKAEAAE